MAESSWNDSETYRSDFPLDVDNLPHLHGDASEFSAIVAVTEAQLIRENEDWRWSDVASVFPLSDVWIDKPVRRPRSAIHRHEYLISASSDRLYAALLLAIDRHELMRSIIVWKENRAGLLASSPDRQSPADEWYAVIRSSATGLAERRIEVVEVDAMEEMTDVNSDDYTDGLRVQKPGFQVYFTIVKLRRDASQCGLLYQINHSIFDITSIHLFLADLNAALAGTLTTKTAPSYGPFAYWSFMLPWTDVGRDNLNFHVKRLSGISRNGRAAMWPSQRATGWMRGNDAGWYGDDRSERVPLGPTGKEQMGLYGDYYACSIRGLRDLRLQHGISAAKAIKAAQILFNVHTTGAEEAIFVGAEGGRMAAKAGSVPLDLQKVPGPVVELALTRFYVGTGQESTLDFLHRVQADQLSLSAHCHYHQGHLRRRLAPSDCDYINEEGARQLFNWAPKVPLDFSRIKLVKFEGRSDYGLSWVYMTRQDAEQETLLVEVSWDNCQMTPAEAEGWTRQLLAAAQWLVDPANSHRLIRECTFDTSRIYVPEKGHVQ